MLQLLQQSVFPHVACIYANLLEQKKAFAWEKSWTPTRLVWDTNMAAVSLFWDTLNTVTSYSQANKAYVVVVVVLNKLETELSNWVQAKYYT